MSFRGQVVIVTGSREWTDREAIYQRLKQYRAGTILLHGDNGNESWAVGADRIAASVGRDLGFQVVGHPYFTDAGKAGGPLRNKLLVALGAAYQGALYSVVVEAFPLPGSRGTWDCVRKADEANLPVITGGLERPWGPSPDEIGYVAMEIRKP